MATAESLQRTVTIQGKRYYDVGVNKLFPSVTTILGKMTDKSGLDEWRKRVGEEEADRISKFSANRGTVMHQMIEYFLEKQDLEKSERLKYAQLKIVEFIKSEGYTQDELIVGRRLFYNFYNAGIFDRIKRVLSLEETLWSLQMGGYAGRVDTIYEDFDGNVIILDFKTSRKPKKEEWIENYFMQISAYFIAYWERTGIKPGGGEIWISCEDGTPQIFNMDVNMIKKFSAKFLGLVKEFHKRYENS